MCMDTVNFLNNEIIIHLHFDTYDTSWYRAWILLICFTIKYSYTFISTKTNSQSTYLSFLFFIYFTWKLLFLIYHCNSSCIFHILDRILMMIEELFLKLEKCLIFRCDNTKLIFKPYVCNNRPSVWYGLAARHFENRILKKIIITQL